MCIPTRTRLTYNNDKPWFTAKLRQLRQAKEDAYRKRDKQAKYTLEKEIRVTKRNYSGKLRNKISSSDSASVWKGLKDIINYKTPSPSTVENQQLADYFNDFYCRFGQTGCVLSPLLFSLYTNDCTSKDPPSSSSSLQTTPHWSASFRTVTSLLTDRRLRSWLFSAVLTTWSLTRSKQWRWSWTSGEPWTTGLVLSVWRVN